MVAGSGDTGAERGAGSGIPADPDLPPGLDLPPAGERAALARWAEFRSTALPRYGQDRDRPDLPATSGLSAYLKFGAVHPRTLLADLGVATSTAGTATSTAGTAAGTASTAAGTASTAAGTAGTAIGTASTAAGTAGTAAGVERLRGELAWREFYADVLWHQPRTARECLRRTLTAIELDTGPDADERFAAWAEGRTGYPIVDAGMRQLRAEAWVHNRTRMIVASFLVKDLHLDWRRGAAEFMGRLVDGDLASNSAGWQWVAGCGTDAAPYYRVFNPIIQGRKFDPSGDYVRQYVPELRGITGPGVHEPWRLAGGPPAGYPPPIVDHATERTEALARYTATRTAPGTSTEAQGRATREMTK